MLPTGALDHLPNKLPALKSSSRGLHLCGPMQDRWIRTRGIVAFGTQRRESEPCFSNLLSVTTGELLSLSDPESLHLQSRDNSTPSATLQRHQEVRMR